MALNEAWSIKARAHACSITEKKFTEGEEFYTAIYPDPESSGYLRMDFSIEAWENREEQHQKPFSFWKNTYEPPVVEQKEEVVTKESAEELLSRLIEEDEVHTENARYILAVMLERQKLLKETDNQETPTGIIRIYEHRKTGDVYIVLDPNIPLDQVEAVQIEVSQLLDGDKEDEETPDSEEEPAKSDDAESSETDTSDEDSEEETEDSADESTDNSEEE